MTVILYPFPYK